MEPHTMSLEVFQGDPGAFESCPDAYADVLRQIFTRGQNDGSAL